MKHTVGWGELRISIDRRSRRRHAVAIVRVGKAPCRFVAWPAGFDGEARAQMADRSFAALTVLAEQVAAALG
jgi:hypothetical protein